MINTTKAQRIALKKVYERTVEDIHPSLRMGYREWRKHLVFPGPDCIMVKFCGMWLGIEKDGYTHS